MNSLASLLLATATAVAMPPSSDPTSPCPGLRENGFRLAIDWDRARPAEVAGDFVRSVSATAGSGRAAALDCPPGEPTGAAPVGWVLAARAHEYTVEAASPEVPPSPNNEGSSWWKPFSFFVSTSGVYDTNINHDENPVRDWGLVYGVGTHFETDAVEIDYEIASHNYRNTDRWDRISHSLTTSYEQKFTRRLSMEAVGEMALRGSSEDRELGDQYILEPRIHYRLSPSSRLRFYGAYRLRRYDENAERDATNRYVGLELRNRLGHSTLDVGYRWETNRADGSRFSYDRQTYSAQLSTPFAGGLHRLGIELRYRPQRYTDRFLDDDVTLRRDRRWILTVGASFALSRNLELLPGYKLETRSSNDPSKKFDAHAAYVGVRYWFGRGGNPAIANVRRPAPPADAAREEPVKKDTASQKEDRIASPSVSAAPAPAPIVRSVARSGGTRTADIPPDSPNPKRKWGLRAEADRRRLLSGPTSLYSIQLETTCEPEALEEAWRHDSGARAMWLLTEDRRCYRVFWGHFPSEREANRALTRIPRHFLRTNQVPWVVPISFEESARR
jgi:hypothetical protein